VSASPCLDSYDSEIVKIDDQIRIRGPPKSKALIAQGCFGYLEGVPLASAIKGLYIPRAAADTAWSATLALSDCQTITS
jgi:hypothetical protein